MQIRTLLLVAASSCAAPALACDNPPVAVVPDGNTATKEQLLAAQAQVKEYLAAMERYVACMDEAQTAAGDDAPAEFKALMANRHNTAIAEMETVAKHFKEQIDAYKAGNPEPDEAYPNKQAAESALPSPN